jgi:TRAP-type C4-dicarboxylate transport system permease small subunit
MRKLLRSLERGYNHILVVLSVIITLLAIYQVLARYGLRWDITWTEETMRYINVSIVMLGIGVVSKTGSFITITVLYDLINRKSKIGGRILLVFQNSVKVVFFALMFYFGVKLTLQAINIMTPTTRITFSIVYLPLPIGGLLGLADAFLKLITSFRVSHPILRNDNKEMI